MSDIVHIVHVEFNVSTGCKTVHVSPEGTPLVAVREIVRGMRVWEAQQIKRIRVVAVEDMPEHDVPTVRV